MVRWFGWHCLRAEVIDIVAFRLLVVAAALASGFRTERATS